MLPCSDLDDAQCAFLFESRDGELYGVALDRDGSSLPRDRDWNFRQQYPLGVHEPAPIPIDPEPILRGVNAWGFFVWRKHRMEPFGTSQ
jgi:hypothetical protein